MGDRRAGGSGNLLGEVRQSRSQDGGQHPLQQRELAVVLNELSLNPLSVRARGEPAFEGLGEGFLLRLGKRGSLLTGQPGFLQPFHKLANLRVSNVGVPMMGESVCLD